MPSITIVKRRQIATRKIHFSPALKNPEISYRRDINGIQIEVVKGQQIIREAPPYTYQLKVGKFSLLNFDKWVIIDTYLLKKKQNLSIDDTDDLHVTDEHIRIALQHKCKDIDFMSVFTEIKEKLRVLETLILSMFKKTDEYQWWIKTVTLQLLVDEHNIPIHEAQKAAEKRRRETEQKARERIEEEKRRKEAEQEAFFRSFFNTNDKVKIATYTMSPDEIRIVLSCYKAMAKQLHPDKGGSTKDMIILNNLKEKLKRL